MYQHQDWNQVILRKTTEKPVKETVTKSSQSSTTTVVNNVPAWKMEKLADEGKIPFVSSAIANEIIQKRVAMKLSQDALAKKLNMPVRLIKDIESCKAVQNNAQLDKIRRALSVK